MPTTYNDQFFLMDPYGPPAAGTVLTPQFLSLVDQNDDGDIDRFDNDAVNGLDVKGSFPGDTVTISTSSGNITYTGTTFYTANGGLYFTPTDGQLLQQGSFVSSTFVCDQGPLDLRLLAPSCFTPGTLIATPTGVRAIETLKPGDLVDTLDDGPQPLLRILRDSFRAVDEFAPIRFAKGAIGNDAELTVSQQHRILITGWQAELYCGQSEVLVAAKHLVNGRTIRVVPGGSVDYIHLLFDRHQIVFANGAPSESFFPSALEPAHDDATRAELLRLFPSLTDTTIPPAILARPEIRRMEARLIAA